jgi:hypothetical protein
VGSFKDDNVAPGSQIVGQATNHLFQGISDPVHTETATLGHFISTVADERELETETDSEGEEDEYDHDQHYGVHWTHSAKQYRSNPFKNVGSLRSLRE